MAQVVVGGEVVAASRPDLDRRRWRQAPESRRARAPSDSVPEGRRGLPGRLAAARSDGRRTGRRPWCHVAAPLDDVDESVGLLARSLALAVPAVDRAARRPGLGPGRAHAPARRVDPARGGADRCHRPPAARAGAPRRRRGGAAGPHDERHARARRGRQRPPAPVRRRRLPRAAHAAGPDAVEIEVDLAHPDRADPGGHAPQRARRDRSGCSDSSTTCSTSPGPTAPGRAGDGTEADGADAAPPAGPGGGGRGVAGPRRRSPVAIDVLDLAPVTVAGDPAELRRVVANLLDNATRHARSHVEVAVADRRRDRGGRRHRRRSGVPADQAERIFERFARLDDARSAAEGGTGLGLAIAREIAERHGGTLTLDTDPPRRRPVRAPLRPRPRPDRSTADQGASTGSGGVVAAAAASRPAGARGAGSPRRWR